MTDVAPDLAVGDVAFPDALNHILTFLAAAAIAKGDFVFLSANGGAGAPPQVTKVTAEAETTIGIAIAASEGATGELTVAVLVEGAVKSEAGAAVNLRGKMIKAEGTTSNQFIASPTGATAQTEATVDVILNKIIGFTLDAFVAGADQGLIYIRKP